MNAINQSLLRVWAQQPPIFLSEAILDVDGTIVGTNAECKQGIDMAYNGTRGYHPLLISLATTSEPLYSINRSGNRPSHEHAAEALDKMTAFCRQSGFARIVLRGDADFTQTAHLDRWDESGDVCFVFGIDARATLKGLADDLPAEEYRLLERPPRYAIKTKPREKPERIKPEIVRERGYKTAN
jgi:Transposase DDE domain group 1